ncbi:hypothetical protein MMC07_002239 [Pseudocyphellaria aurata]|nr:hypothetical protein [Pseudocyphellaria aurata]
MAVRPLETAVRHVEHLYQTRIMPVDPVNLGEWAFSNPRKNFLEDWEIVLSKTSPDAAHLLEAVSQLRNTDIPVAFPTETVYGLGADATRASAVLGIYAAKQRPSDNPLIVHISSLSQLRRLLLPPGQGVSMSNNSIDPIPSIYHPLIARFWPGALTILLPLPKPSPFAPQVTASLSTVAVRMPSSLLALALIHTSQVPLAAPSANASTKPSPTTAAHVLHDLSGRIKIILDGGPCDIGVESTVVDGLVQPPVILRPGGVSIDSLRKCPGWEGVVAGYKDGQEVGIPRAPGMKYRHYSPKARVILVEGPLNLKFVRGFLEDGRSIGILRTREWKDGELGQNGHGSVPTNPSSTNGNRIRSTASAGAEDGKDDADAFHDTQSISPLPSASLSQIQLESNDNKDDSSVSKPTITDVWTIGLGPDVADVARGLFFGLRDLDLKGVAVIFVESVGDDGRGEAAAAVMNRLRKAAEMEIKS